MKQDYNGVRTAQDLERKYDFTQLETAKEINNNIIQANKNLLISNMNNELKLFVEAVTKYIEDYSVDGNITTYYFSGVPSLNNNPAVEWTTDTEKNNHIWNLYYDKETGYVYMFKNENGTYLWERLEDYDVEKALALANALTDTQDNKRQVFFTQPSPPYSNGDIWVDNEETYICQISKPEGETYESADFIISSKYVDNTIAVKANNKFTVLAGSVLEIENNVDSYSRTLTQTIKVVDEQGNYIGDRSQKTTSLTQDVEGINLSIGSWDASKGSLSQQTADLRTDVAGIRGEIGDITDITITKDGIGTLNFNGDDESINESNPIYMQIYPTTEDLSKVYPSLGLYPSSTLYLVSNITIDFYNQTEDEHIYYTIPSNLRRLNDTYDEFIYDYENDACKIIRRIAINEYNVKSILATPVEESLEFPDIRLTSGKYVVSFKPFNTAYMKIRLMSQNMYTSQYATKVELNNKFEYTADHFTTELTKKVGNDEVISKINQTAEQITIDAGKVNIAGVITAINNNTTTTIDGNKITTGTLSASQITTGTLNGSNVTITNLNADNITGGTLSMSRIASGTITGDKLAANTITASKVASDIITTTNFSAQSINANQITTGTIDASRVNVTNINASNITSGTINGEYIYGGTITGTNLSGAYISGGSMNVNDTFIVNGYGKVYLGTTYGFLSTRYTNHPYASALNVGYGSGGVTFYSGQYESDTGSYLGNIACDTSGAMYINSSGTININHGYQTQIGGDIGIGNLVISDTTLRGPHGARVITDYNCRLSPASGYYAYVGTTAYSDRILTNGGSPSSLNVKKNLKSLKKEYDDIYKDIQTIDAYNYDYKYENVKDDLTKDYGFIIDEIENTKHLSKYFRNYDAKRYIDGNKLIKKTDDEEDMSNYKEIDIKEWDKESYIKGLFVMIKTLQNKIDKLEEKINE